MAQSKGGNVDHGEDRKSYWDRVENYEDAIISVFHSPGGRIVRRAIQEAAKKATSAADFGCGPGYFLEDLANVPTLYAVDWSQTQLDSAQKIAPNHTAFIQSDLREIQLPQKVDLILSINSLMPESHTDCLQILDNMFAQLKPGGRAIFVVPSLESRLYLSTMEHFIAAQNGEEEASLQKQVSRFVREVNNPLGYVMDGNGEVTKYWLEAEIHHTITRMLGHEIDDVQKAYVGFERYGREPQEAEVEMPWMWLVSMRKA